ncbi:phage baseplate protein [Paraburkholderia tropica]|uniref:phage baseplate protein n=1 Tax=Paraburkholderia tropica TaxID=92647 RepID=UPI003016C2D3
MANGIPNLLGQVASVTNTVSLVTSDVELVLSLFASPKWGIGQDGVYSIVPDSIVSVEYKRDWSVPNYPQESGAFQSYNKVSLPYDAHIRMTKGGTVSDRQSFLTTLDAMAASLELYDVVMPEVVYSNANIVHYDYRRTSTNGVGLLTVDVWLEEIRVAPDAAFTNTAAASGSDSQQTGMVQPQTATTAQSAAVPAVQ